MTVWASHYLVLNERVDSLQHPLTGELVGQVRLNLATQTHNKQHQETLKACLGKKPDVENYTKEQHSEVPNPTIENT